MRTASEVAEGICNISGLGWKGADAWFYRLVTEALTAFRNEALEEAARCAENHMNVCKNSRCVHVNTIGDEIRALKK